MNESAFRSLFHTAIGEVEIPADVSSQARVALKQAVHEGWDARNPNSKVDSADAPRARSIRNRLDDRDTPVSRRTELSAGIAAILLAAIVVGTFAYLRFATHLHNVAPPITTASPTPAATPLCFSAPSCKPLSQPLKVDRATPVILYYDPAIPDGFSHIDGLTWDGQLSGRVTVNPQIGSDSNPAGTLFVGSGPSTISPLMILDRSGRVAAKLVGGPYAEPGVGLYFVGFWADDETHYCQVVPIFGAANPGPGTLQLTTPGGKPRDVAQVGMTDPNRAVLSVTACSTLADRAVVMQNNGDGRNNPIQYWVVQLSTGRVLWTHEFTGSNLVASRDGQYVAEVESNGTSTIYDANGAVVGQVAGSVEGFSWDGSLAVVYTWSSPVGSSFAYGTHARVIRWRDGTVIWAAPPAKGLGGSQPEPGGTSLAITILDLAHPFDAVANTFYQTDLYVVAADGRVLGQRESNGILHR